MTTKKYIITADDVEDNLTSTLQDVPLSANQGRVLNTSKVDKNQGTAQAGKVLGIGADGLVYPMVNEVSNIDASKITSGTLAAARLPKATTSAFGAVKVGSGLSVSGGVISASGGGGAPSISISSGTTCAIGALFSDYNNNSARMSNINVSHSEYTGNGYMYRLNCALTGSVDMEVMTNSNTSFSGTLYVMTVGSDGSKTMFHKTFTLRQSSRGTIPITFNNTIAIVLCYNNPTSSSLYVPNNSMIYTITL